jgi:hypothetical protein
MGLSIRWLYPRNWSGNPPDSGGYKRIVVQVVGDNLSADYSYQQIVDISELRTTQGLVPTRTVVEWVKGSAQNMDDLKLYWDRVPRVPIGSITLPDSGEKFPVVNYGGSADPGIAGDGTGDILLSTNGITASGYFDITFSMRLKA